MNLRSLVFAAALLAGGDLLASVTEEVRLSYSLDDGGRFSISNVNGSIAVSGGAGEGVEVVATKSADSQKELDEIKIDVKQSAGEIVIETKIGESAGWFSRANNSGRVDYRISLPAGTLLDSVETVNGDVAIGGVSGKVVAESVNGNLDVRDLAGDASLATVNGEVNARFARCAGQQDIKAETVNGRVTLSLPEDADVEISADTLNGSIDGADWGLEPDKGFVGSDLRGKIGEGSARLNIDTVNGSIRIKK